jgi:hypothetical protein
LAKSKLWTYKLECLSIAITFSQIFHLWFRLGANPCDTNYNTYKDFTYKDFTYKDFTYKDFTYKDFTYKDVTYKDFTYKDYLKRLYLYNMTLDK